MTETYAGKTLVIGFGNPLRADDGVAWHIVERLQEAEPRGDEVFILTHQLTPELAETISGAAQVIFVDAAEGSPPGVVAHFPLEARPDSASLTFHELTPPGLLALTEQLYGSPPPAIMLTVTGESFALSEALSAPVAAAVPEAVDRVRTLLAVAS